MFRLKTATVPNAPKRWHTKRPKKSGSGTPRDIVDATIIQCMTWLHECYKCLKHDAINWQPRLERAARMFSNNYVALHEATGNRWRPKPKLHYFLELCSDGTKPSLVWTYRDEDFGGGWAAMARRRGGKRGPTAQSSMAIHNWRNSQPVPRLT